MKTATTGASSLINVGVTRLLLINSGVKRQRHTMINTESELRP